MANKKTSLSHDTTPDQSIPQSFMSVLETVRGQIGWASLAGYTSYAGIINEAARIITEVYMLRDTASIDINGEEVSAELVKSIYRELRQDHIIEVLNRFIAKQTLVRSPKKYIRTCLYNVVFDMALTEANREAAELSELDTGRR